MAENRPLSYQIFLKDVPGKSHNLLVLTVFMFIAGITPPFTSEVQYPVGCKRSDWVILVVLLSLQIYRCLSDVVAEISLSY